MISTALGAKIVLIRKWDKDEGGFETTTPLFPVLTI